MSQTASKTLSADPEPTPQGFPDLQADRTSLPSTSPESEGTQGTPLPEGLRRSIESETPGASAAAGAAIETETSPGGGTDIETETPTGRRSASETTAP